MLPKPTSSEKTQKGTVFQYDGSDLNAIVEGVKHFFENRAYRLESGEPGHGIYGTGSNVMRIIFGAFAKRYSFSVKITNPQDRPSVAFHLEKAMSGAMGGVIGYRKMTKEYNAIVEALSAGVA
jgi:hypothetical protein